MKSWIRLLTAALTLMIAFMPLSAHFATRAATFIPATAYREPVRAKHGMVASTSQLASHVGVDVMKRGGNAVDAAIAVAFALAVTYPAAGNLGGGGFMMIRLNNGKTTAIDYREMAPGAANRNIYLDPQGNLIKGEGSSTVGYRASGVPGTVAGMELALKNFGSGKLSWSQLLEPARRLAAAGFPLGYQLARSFRGNDYLSRVPRNAPDIFARWELLQRRRAVSTTGPGRDIRTSATVRTKGVLSRSDGQANCRRHEEAQWFDYHGRYACLRCQGTRATAGQLSGL